MTGQVIQLGREEFGNRFRPLCEWLFDLEASPKIRDRGWERVLLPYGMNLEPEFVRSLCDATKGSGDDQVVATTLETVPPFEFSATFPCDSQAFEDAQTSTVLGHLIVGVWGQSGSWAMLCNNPDDYTMLSGGESVLAAFFEAAGGESRIRDRFLQFARDEWQVDADLKRRVLASVGW